MDGCDEMLDGLVRDRATQVELALAAEAEAVVALHIDLAAFAAERARAVADLCDD